MGPPGSFWPGSGSQYSVPDSPFSSLHPRCPGVCYRAVTFSTISHGLLKDLKEIGRRQSQCTVKRLDWRELPLIWLLLSNTLLQISIISYSDCVPSIWPIHTHSWLTPGFLSILSACQRACAVVDHSVSNPAASPQCLAISLLFTLRVNYPPSKKLSPSSDYIEYSSYMLFSSTCFFLMALFTGTVLHLFFWVSG